MAKKPSAKSIPIVFALFHVFSLVFDRFFCTFSRESTNPLFFKGGFLFWGFCICFALNIGKTPQTKNGGYENGGLLTLESPLTPLFLMGGFLFWGFCLFFALNIGKKHPKQKTGVTKTGVCWLSIFTRFRSFWVVCSWPFLASVFAHFRTIRLLPCSGCHLDSPDLRVFPEASFGDCESRRFLSIT